MPGAAHSIYVWPCAIQRRCSADTHAAVYLLEDLEGQAHRGQRPFGQPLRIDDHQVAAALDFTVDDADQIAIAFGRARGARHEAAFLHARIAADDEGLRAALRVIEARPGVVGAKR